MVKWLTKSGNSYALLIDRSIMDLLNITPNTPLKVTTDGRSLHIVPAGDEITPDELGTSMSKFNKRFGRMMKRLAE